MLKCYSWPEVYCGLPYVTDVPNLERSRRMKKKKKKRKQQQEHNISDFCHMEYCRLPVPKAGHG